MLSVRCQEKMFSRQFYIYDLSVGERSGLKSYVMEL